MPGTLNYTSLLWLFRYAGIFFFWGRWLCWTRKSNYLGQLSGALYLYKYDKKKKLWGQDKTKKTNLELRLSFFSNIYTLHMSISLRYIQYLCFSLNLLSFTCFKCSYVFLSRPRLCAKCHRWFKHFFFFSAYIDIACALILLWAAFSNFQKLNIWSYSHATYLIKKYLFSYPKLFS